MAWRPDNGHLEAMKGLKAVSVVFLILLASCATIPVQGEAVECDACRTIWIRLFPSSGAPGIYRLNHEEKHRPCANCGKLAMRYFQTGEIPARCPQCDGRLTVRPVNVTP
jgi:DNA-directed RNA polymerase subunit RPC12/RpoP